MQQRDYDIYRTSTPLQTLRFKNNPETTYSVILVTYEQNDAILFEKEKEDMTFSSATVEGETVYYGVYSLSQQETKSLVADELVKVQVRILTPTGNSVPTKVKYLTVGEVLNDRILTND